MKQPTHVVLKPFKANAPVELKAGQRVNGDTWPNLVYLERYGYVRPLRPDEQPSDPAEEASPRNGSQP